MAKSVLRLTPQDYYKIRERLLKGYKTEKQHKAIRLFDLKMNDRMMLEELVLLLEPFQWTTDEFQSNKVSISRVFPSIKYLNEVLEEKKDEIKILKTFCTSLITNLNIRFGKLLYFTTYYIFCNFF